MADTTNSDRRQGLSNIWCRLLASDYDTDLDSLASAVNPYIYALILLADNYYLFPRPHILEI